MPNSFALSAIWNRDPGYGRRPVQRLQDHGILGPKTILGHCIHVNTAEMEMIQATGTMCVNNPESIVLQAVVNIVHSLGNMDMEPRAAIVGGGHFLKGLVADSKQRVTPKHRRQHAAGVLFGLG